MILRFRIILISVVFISLPLAGQAQVRLPGDSLIIHGIARIYNFQHLDAINTFQKVIRQHPEHPAGYLLLGVAKWDYARGAVGIPASEDTLLVTMKRAAEIAKPYADKHPMDPYAWLLYGMSLGIQARVDLARSKWIPAALHGYHGIRQIKKAQKLAPELPDLQIALGAFHYYVGLSGPLLKFGASLVGLKGTEEQGRAELQVAADHGRYVWPEANNILGYLYGYLEDRVPKGLTYTDTLITSFPANPYVWSICADLQLALGDTLNALQSMEQIKSIIPHLTPVYHEEYLNKMTYLSGLMEFYRKNYEQSVDSLSYYLDHKLEEYDVHAENAQLFLGKNYSRMGESDKAVFWFREVTKWDIPTRMGSEAKQSLEQLESD